MSGKMDCYGVSHIGRARASNEDQFLIADLSKSMRIHQTSLDFDPESTLFGNSQGKLLLVADGMGGHAAGEQASRLAVEVMTSFVLNQMSWPHPHTEDHEDVLLDELRLATQCCQERLLTDVAQKPERTGMGTTLTIAYVAWPLVHIVHVGDSRCYVFRNGRLRQLTTDHTLAQSLIDSGTVVEAELDDSPLGNMLWNVIGGQKGRLEPQMLRTDLKLNDVLLLCTDGLTKHVGDELLAEVIAMNLTAQQSCELLIAAANDAGGTDNSTVVIARFIDADEETLPLAESAAEIDLDAETTIMQLPPLPTSCSDAQEDTVIESL